MRAVNLEKLLPADIPAGERILWHGRPEWVSLGRRAFRADFIGGYFGVMTVWNFGLAASSTGVVDGIVSAAKTAGSGALALTLLYFLAWLSSRTTLYVVTSRRVVMKVGIALPIFFNLPFTTVASASLRTYADGSGDVPIALGPEQKIAYLHLWPHARPFRMAHPEPALRCVPRALEVAEILSRALIEAANEGQAFSSAEAGVEPARADQVVAYPAGAIAAA